MIKAQVLRTRAFLLSGLGLVLRCRQNGDFARTRPVFVAPEWAETCTDSWEGSVPRREWEVY
ncbi:hypothetical protein AB0J38_06310 [Streptomyces sp. NPDC050095]|uniref:hypothetical protein n=1 Tax=unclassified Streptomyces TaxID=2593676 RepID=UPI003433F05F